MDIPLNQTILFDHRPKLKDIEKLRVQIDELRVQFDERREWNEAQDKKNNVIMRHLGFDPITLEPI